MSQTEPRTTSAPAPVRLAPPTAAERAALNAECIAAILAGRPFPDAIRVPVVAMECPTSVREGIERILRGRAGGAAH